VRLSDGSAFDLPSRVPLSEALAALRDAKQRMGAGQYGTQEAAGPGGNSGSQTDSLGSLHGWLHRQKPQPSQKAQQVDGRTAGIFDQDNRMALPGSLHRISAAAGRDGSVTGLTFRVGRHLPGAAAPLRDLLAHLAQVHRDAATGAAFGGKLGGSASLLLLGRPGKGKTTLLRDVARVFADDLGLAVVVVDTNNEIAGDGADPHPCIGSAVRLQVRALIGPAGCCSVGRPQALVAASSANARFWGNST
jgi:hypothetical protein